MKSIQEIEDEAKALGLTNAEMCKRAGMNKDTWQKWKRKLPKSLLMYRELLNILEVEKLRKEMGLK
jgi:DNA-binding transcriptional regulator YiaG